MTKIEIVDDAGDEFTLMNIPIPFYVRCRLEEGLTKYRAKILDEAGHTRGYYTGASIRDYLELHVPVIPLRNHGKLFIEIEIWNEDASEMTTHTATIEYVDQETYDSLIELNKTLIEGQSDYIKSEEKEIQEIEDPPVLSDDEIRYLVTGDDTVTESVLPEIIRTEDEEISREIPEKEQTEEISTEIMFSRFEESHELTEKEIQYLSQREEILGEIDESKPIVSIEEEE